MSSITQGFAKSLALTVVSEIGDNTFIVAAILAMRHPRKLVLSGCLTAVITMTILSVALGWVAPNLTNQSARSRLNRIPRKWTHHITTLLFFVFGIWSFWDALTEEEEDEVAEFEAKLDADSKVKTGAKTKQNSKLKKQRRPFLTQFFSPIFLKAFSLTFFGEWGDKSQLATISLAADENPIGVVLGGVLGQILCTTIAVMGGKSLASRISEKMVELAGGVVFIIFGIQSFFSKG